jgi:hypothetical protein
MEIYFLNTKSERNYATCCTGRARHHTNRNIIVILRRVVWVGGAQGLINYPRAQLALLKSRSSVANVEKWKFDRRAIMLIFICTPSQKFNCGAKARGVSTLSQMSAQQPIIAIALPLIYFLGRTWSTRT